MNSVEVNFDGIVGPTHHYGGLASGNLASLNNQSTASSPRKAALQGLEKMQFCHKLGLKQAVLLPHERPDLKMLKQLGFTGNNQQLLTKAYRQAPQLLSACYSASSMWAANAATISPSIDCADSYLHITPANLQMHLHRSIETEMTAKILQKIFNDDHHFKHHQPLPPTREFGDEGAANHMRVCPEHHLPGMEIFVYGEQASHVFETRQTCASSRSIARCHRLHHTPFFMWEQNPQATDMGVFHNDVIAVANANVLLIHEKAFVNQQARLTELEKTYHDFYGRNLSIIQIPEQDLSLSEVVYFYLFNSQLVTLPNNSMALICPQECQSPRPYEVLQKILVSHNPIQKIYYVNTRQSMLNGGGPACLRLRVLLNDDELKAIHQPIIWTNELFEKLAIWVNKHYRETLSLTDLCDPQLMQESYDALDQLTTILDLGDIYPFQQ